MRHFTIVATGIAFAALLSSAPAIAQPAAYNTDNIGWNRGGLYTTDLGTGAASCFVAPGKEAPCASNAQVAAPSPKGQRHNTRTAPSPKGQRHARQ